MHELYLCIKQDFSWQISLHGAYRLEILNKRLLLSEGSGAGDSAIKKCCAWVDER